MTLHKTGTVYGLSVFHREAGTYATCHTRSCTDCESVRPAGVAWAAWTRSREMASDGFLETRAASIWVREPVMSKDG
jgi:hypothetical protein